MRKGYVDIPQGQVHYREEGVGEPIILLHGQPLSSEEFSNIMPILAKSYRAIAMDLPGFGNSYLPPRPDYSVEEYGRSVISFLDAMGLGRVNLVGHFAGATIAVEVAAVYPDRIDKLVLSGLLVKVIEDIHNGVRQYEQIPDDVIKEDGKRIMDKWELWERVMQPYVSVQDRFTYFVIGMDRYRRYWRVADYYACEIAVVNYRIEDKLSKIKAPTLLLSGEKGFAVNEVDYTKSKIPWCEAKIIGNQGWYPGVEKPEEFSEAILDFLKNSQV